MKSKMLTSMLSGPIDIDKMDYLFRDSLHAGVPYGRNFDQQRLIGSLCMNEAGDGLAISDKGKTRSRRVTGLSRKHQAQLSVAVKRAREVALLPYVGQ